VGTQIRFVQAPRGDATQAPPAIDETSQLGTSARAAREDHTHEGVHKIVAGGGIKVTPESGLGDVAVETLHWRPPVQSFTDLPASGNQPGDARVVIGEGAIYVWTGGGWTKISGDGGGGGGGSGGGFVLDERLNHLRGQIRVSQLHGASRVELYSEVIDDFNDDQGIDPGKSSSYQVASSRLQPSGDPDFYQLSPPTAPPARYFHAMAYDKLRGRVVLFGGRTSTGLNDTWLWDGSNWTLIEPQTKPSPRYGHAMAFDEARGVVLLFGGYSSFNDTWIFDGSNWIQLSPPSRPGERYDHAMAYDAQRGVVVLFGGYYAGNRLGDTWEWNWSTWVRKTPGTSPSARYGHKMVYDRRRNVIVLFGGLGSSGALNDTWEYDGESWVQVNTPTKPPARQNHMMAFDESRGVVVLFGGLYGTTRFNDVWEYDGTDWKQVVPGSAPPGREYGGMAWDGTGILLFGGRGPGGVYLADTWEYRLSGTAVVVTRPLSLPWQPTKGYLTALGEATSFALSRDGGQTFTPVAKDGWVDLTSQPPGSQLVAKVELSGSQSLDALAYGATNV